MRVLPASSVLQGTQRKPAHLGSTVWASPLVSFENHEGEPFCSLQSLRFPSGTEGTSLLPVSFHLAFPPPQDPHYLMPLTPPLPVLHPPSPSLTCPGSPSAWIRQGFVTSR